MVEFVAKNSRVPVLGHGEGICHVYVDRAADIEKALRITIDSKVQYPAACNAAETLLVHEDVAGRFLPQAVSRLIDSGVEVEEAITHIHRYGSKHTETIVTEDRGVARHFIDEVDAAGVFHNASTRFADGFRYGLGAELGISTNKLHARGPVGLEGLTTYKYKLFGDGHIVAEYSSGARHFKHRPLQ